MDDASWGVMGMKVVKKSPHKKWEKKKTCPHCGAVLLVSEEDLHEYHHHEEGYWTGFKCPECKKLVEVKVPDAVYDRVSERGCED